MNWTRDFPERAGHFWFHGRLHHEMRTEPETFLVTAVRVNGVMRVATHGVVLDRSSIDGVFTHADVPYPPEGTV